MKVLIAYSSRTGNTRRVAEALAKAAPEGSLLARVEDTPSADGFDVVFAGYWLDRGGPDAKAKEFLHSLHGKHIVLFETMGADPRSEHAYTGFANAGTALSPDNQIVGVFAVQGAVDPALLEMMRKMPEGSAHHSAQMEQTVKEAAKHPNAEDLKRAETYMKQFIETYGRYHH